MITAVIGAGPAGMLAALSATAADTQVVLVDEQHALGGHLRYDRYTPTTSDEPGDAWLSELTSAVANAQIDVRLQTVVWAAYRTGESFDLMLTSHGTPETIKANHVVIASGTTDIELNVPGVTVPGVMTERAARILIEMYGVIPGGRFAIIGADDSRTVRLSSLLGSLGGSVTTFDPENVVEIGSPDGVSLVRTNDLARIEVDVVVMAVGERPDLQLVGMLDVPRVFDADRNGWYANPDAIPDGLAIVGGASLGASTPAELIASAIDRDSTQLNLPVTTALANPARSRR